MDLLSRGIRDKKKITRTRIRSLPNNTSQARQREIQCPECKAMVPVFASNTHVCRLRWLKKNKCETPTGTY